jgi:hypothetical protein
MKKIYYYIATSVNGQQSWGKKKTGIPGLNTVPRMYHINPLDVARTN